ncbi:restriction endonuclease subunit S [Vibrio jasicida]|uniref:restriction endonuclease subunit S n=1 Tax=Vibrio jasicida TaxID=766224 RepID=UPI00148C0CE6|nr:restriction endonuclease subunit S [Vibrio jasicida]NOJ17265.1 type I restriction endonuclease subunit S [Vibrio jasicida]
MSQVIPEGWSAIKIEDIADVKGGKRLPKGESFSDGITAHPYLRVTDFYNETIDTSDLKYLKVDTHQQIANYTISKEDLYISIAGTIGLVGSIPPSLDGANLTENAAKICNIIGANNTYLKRFLNSHTAKDQFKDKATSSGQPKLALFRIRDCDLLLPPLAEQKVIADKLDELLAQVESTKARLDAIPAILKLFRQSVLAAAVSGKLTEEWRGRIERNWQQKTIGDLAVVSTGKTPKRTEPKYWDEPSIPWLTSAVTGSAYCSEADQFVTDIAVSECKLKLFSPGTLLLAMYGEGKTRGQVTELKIEATCNQACAAISVNNALSLTAFVKLRLQENYEETRKAASGGNQPNLNLNKVRDIPIELPPIEEQTEIVRRVEELFAFADKIEAQVNAAQARVNNLTQSILAEAFRGELTADWRAENPDLISGENSAEALLERIKAEREALVKATKGARKKLVKKVIVKNTQDTGIDKKMSPVEAAIANGLAHKPQEIFDQLTPDLSMSDVFNEISKLLNDNKIEEKIVDGITGFFIKK